MKNIHDLFTEVRQHPDFVAGAIFVTDDFPNREVMVYNHQKRIEEQMVEAGFEAEQALRDYD